MQHRLWLFWIWLCLTPLLEAQPVRGLWVVRHALRSPESIDSLVETAAAAGFNTLLVQVRGRGDAYYHSHLEPRARALQNQPDGFDPLTHVLSRAREKGLKVHAWINTYLVSDLFELPESRQHLIHRQPGWISIPSQLAAELYSLPPDSPRYREQALRYARNHRSQLEGLYLEPAHPQVQEFLTSLWLDILEHYPLDGMHFDYVRYPNREFGYSRPALDAFRQLVDSEIEPRLREVLAVQYTRDPLLYTRLYPDRWDGFRRQQVSDLVSRIYRQVKHRRPEVLVTAAVFPDPGDAYLRRFQDWRGWLKSGVLDGICPMAYDPDSEVFRSQIALAQAYSAGRQVWAGIGAFRLSADSIVEKLRIADLLQTDGVLLFSYNSLAGEASAGSAAERLERIGRLFRPPAH